MTQTVLDKIKAYKLEEIAADKAATPRSASKRPPAPRAPPAALPRPCAVPRARPMG